MLKNLILAIFVLAYCEHALALSCYITDVGELQSSESLTDSYQDCSNYVSTMKKKFNLPDIEEGAPLRCYTVKVNTKKSQNNFRIKGCVPQGHCEQTVKPLVEEEAKKKGFSFRNMKCIECMDDGCNRRGSP